MYFSKIKTNSRKARLGFFALLFLLLQPILTQASYEEVSPYPVYRGSAASSQRMMRLLGIRDAREKGEIYFAVGAGIMSAPQGEFRPQETMTQAQALAAVINSTSAKNTLKLDPKNWKEPYIKEGKSRGILLEEELLPYEQRPNEILDDPVTAEQFSRWLGRSMGQETAYEGAPQTPMTREMAAKAFYDKRDRILPAMGYEHLRGEILKIEEISENSLPKKVITLDLDEGKYANIVAEGDIPMEIGGQIRQDLRDVNPGQKASFYLRSTGSGPDLRPPVLFGNIQVSTSGMRGRDGYPSPEQSYLYHGFLRSLNEAGRSLVLKDENEQLRTYQLHPNVVYRQMEGTYEQPGKGKDVHAGDLPEGREVEITVKDNLVLEIRGFIEPDLDQNGYIPPQSRLIAGTVLSKGEGEITLTDSKTYAISEDVMILGEGQLTDIRDIREGDRIKLFFDEIGSAEAIRIEIEGQQRQADKIIKGSLQSYAVGKRELVLSDVKLLKGDRWELWRPEESEGQSGQTPNPGTAGSNSAGNNADNADKNNNNTSGRPPLSEYAYKNLRLKGSLYDGDRKVAANKIKDFKGQEVYALLSKNQNHPAIEKANIRRGAGLSFSEKIREIDFPNSFLNIDTNIINFTDGTLIVKDGRIVEPGNLAKSATAYVEAGTNRKASLIVMSNTLYTQEGEEYPYAIYRGLLYDVFDYKIQLGDDLGDRVYYKMEQAKWQTHAATSDSPQLPYTDGTYVLDADKIRKTIKDQPQSKDGAKSAPPSYPEIWKKGKIAVKDFREWRYGEGKNARTSKYRDRQVYVITRDENALAIILQQVSGYKEVNTHHVMTGKIRSVNADTGEILLEEVSKYNALRNMFLHQKETEKADFKAGVVIRGEKALSPFEAGNLAGKRAKVLYRQKDTKTNEGIVLIVEN